MTSRHKFFTPLYIKILNPSQFLRVSVSLSQGLDLLESDSIPFDWHNYIIELLALEASFPSSSIAWKGNTQ